MSTPAAGADQATEPETLWSAVCRPSARSLIAVTPIALIAAVVSALFLKALLVEDDWVTPIVGGAVLGALVPVLFARGTRVRITADGELHYGVGPVFNLAIPLAAIDDLTLVDGRRPCGVGVAVDLGAIRFLNRKGQGYPELRQISERHGVPVVIEHAGQAELDAINAHLPEAQTSASGDDAD